MMCVNTTVCCMNCQCHPNFYMLSEYLGNYDFTMSWITASKPSLVPLVRLSSTEGQHASCEYNHQ